MESNEGLPVVQIASQGDWEEWLAVNHASSTGLWLRIAKQAAGVATVSYAEALESAICYGWIDGQKGSRDDRFWLQKFTPRRRGSRWSRINRDKAEELLRHGRLKPAGLAQVEQARQDGRWEAAYAGPRTATVPDDLQRALDEHPAARAFFATLDSRNRYAILYRIQDAKKPETRARRIARYVALLDEGKRLYP